jgi:hypothetical protein
MKKLLLLCLAFSALQFLNAQTNGFVYGISNPSSGVFWFSRMETATGTFTLLQQMPWGGYNTGASSCVDASQDIYYYCNGTKMYKIDPATGMVMNTVQLQIATTAELYHIQYNPCDSMIYGVVNDFPNGIYFAKYNPVNDSVYNLMALPPNLSFCGGCMSVIEVANQTYILNLPYQLLRMSIATSQMAPVVSIINLPNESFGHISYDCTSGNIYGTSANVSEGEKFLAVIDPQTGTVSHVSDHSWPQGLWKPSNGGNCIDQENGIYYYSGAPDLIIGVDIATGDTVSVQSTGQGTFLFAQYFSQCPCDALGTEELAQQPTSVYPNPAGAFLIVQCDDGARNEYFTVTDAAGREVIRTVLNGSRSVIPLGQLAPGMYFWKNEGDGTQGKFIRAAD